MLITIAVLQICFPADALIRKVTGSGAFTSIRMDQLAIGDRVECLRPNMSPSDSKVEGFTAGLCDVYYYISARHVRIQLCKGIGLFLCALASQVPCARESSYAICYSLVLMQRETSGCLGLRNVW